jgi:Bacterial Ig domain/Secretion system C-terminal sorting domain
LAGFTVQQNNFFASHGVQLQAGVTYKFQCRMDADNPNKPVRFSYNTAPKFGGTEITTISPLVTEDFLTQREVSFMVPTTGLYYLITSHPWVSGSYQQLKIDQLRIVGSMNKAPITKITTPSTATVNMVENATLKLRAEATDYDGAIAKVEYFAEGAKIGEATTAPYEITWSNVPAGIYKVYSKATDIEGLADSSKHVIVNVAQNKFSISTLLGGVGVKDEVRASVIQADGTIVLAANLSAIPTTSVAPVLLNGTTAASEGTIIRLNALGTEVLSITKIAAQITDLSSDSLNNIFVSAGASGVLKLNPTASQVIWQKSFTKFAHRIDAGASGKSIVLLANEIEADDETLTGGYVYIYDENGTQLAQFSGASQYSSDVAIDEASGTAISIGFKNFNTNDASNGPIYPVYVPVMRGYSLDGTAKYVAYDWSADQSSPRWLNRSNNNMADARAVRCAIGKDGKLYLMHEVYGGNHCMRYSPFDIMQTVPIVAGDMYFNFANTGTATKIFVGRHDAATGAYLLGQQFTARINPPLNNDNTVFGRYGNVTADADGRVYITGQSAYGIPLTVDHQPGEYIGGAFLLVLSPNLAVREQCIRLTNGRGRALAVASKDHYVFGGSTSNALYAVNPIQVGLSTPNDGWFAVHNTLPIFAKARVEDNESSNHTDLVAGVRMQVYPNPTLAQDMKVNLSGLNDKPFQIEIVSTSGSIVYRTEGVGDAQLEFANLQAMTGTYFVRLITDDEVRTEKVVVYDLK